MRPEDFAICLADDDGPILNERTRRHLFESSQMLVDQLEEDLFFLRIAHMKDHDVDVWSTLDFTKDFLPDTYAASYDIGFVRDFSLSVLTVLYKLGGAWSMPSSVAEELATNAIIQFAEAMREVFADQGEDVTDIDLSGFVDRAFMDLDFEMLFEPEIDGIQHTEVGRQMSLVNLDRSEWFDRFDGSDVPPHPLTWTSAV